MMADSGKLGLLPLARTVILLEKDDLTPTIGIDFNQHQVNHNMNNKTRTLAGLLIAMALAFGGIDAAHAKRMGGGKSFGSKPSYSTPYQRPTPSAPTSQPIRSPAQQQAAAQNQAARQNWAGRGGLMGMLGGLALGGLLGSMFFGGAFEGLNLMDIALFAGLAFLLYRLFAAKSARQPAVEGAHAREAYPPQADPADYRQPAQSTAGFNTDLLFGKGKAVGSAPAPQAFDAGNLPAGFDAKIFLNGAQNVYRHLQAAWDNRDLAEIRSLTTDKVFAEIQEQLRASGETHSTEVLALTAELLDVREVGSELEASVLFDATIRENGGQANPVREAWHFTKPKFSNEPRWYLDGIQQIEN